MPRRTINEFETRILVMVPEELMSTNVTEGASQRYPS